METINAYRRLTHHYVGTCSDLDAHQFVATVRVTPPRVVREGNGHDEGDTTVMHCRAPAGVDLKLLARAIADTLTSEGCSHEWDCCGCASYRTRVRHVGRRRLVISTRTSYNY